MVEVAQVAIAAGLRNPVHLTQAVAVAFAESSGNPRAHNAVPPDDSYGLWQINMLGSLGPSRRQALGITSNDQLYDPAVNAKAMMMISNGGASWRPWSTFGGPRYLLMVPSATAAANAALAGSAASGAAEGAGEAIDATQATAQAAQQAASQLVKAGAWLANRNNWVRIVKVGAGAIVLGAGLFVLSKPARDVVAAPAQQAKQAVSGVVGVAGRGAAKVKGAAA